MVPLFSLPSLLLLSLLLVSLKWLFSSSKPRRNLPPSPWKLPVIGNLHQLSSSPHRSLHELSQKHGPLMLLHLGSVPAVVASTAETAREILKTNDLYFSNKPKLAVTHTLTYGSKDIAFSPYGEYWRQVKSIAVLQLLSNARVQSFRKVREEETANMINRIGQHCGSVINLSEVLVSLTNNTISRVVAGRTYHAVKIKSLVERFTELLCVFTIGTYISWLSWVDRLNGLEGKTKAVAREFDEILEAVVEEHVEKNKHKDGSAGTDESQDLIDVLLDVERENKSGFTFHKDTIKAIIMDVFVAGTDTTTSTLEWVISELIRHPSVTKKLQQELTEVAQGRPMISEDDLEKLHYLNAVFKEAFRLHPPGALLSPRLATQNVKLMGYDVAAGTRALINVWAIQRDPSLWEEAEKFKPERFLNSPIDFKGVHFELLPFGAGRRGCPGTQFAMAIDKLALANLVYRYDLALPDGAGELDMSETTGIAVHRTTPLQLVATPRF